MTPANSSVPDTVGGYTIESVIGAGGQSEVFALSPVAGRPPLALKLSHERYVPLGQDPLAGEYRMLCTLCHPQLVTPRDFGYHDGRAFMVYERIDGPALFDGLDRRKLGSLTRLIRSVSPVLSFLHRRGIIHRDLKPDNFRWQTAPAGGHAKLHLLDLGLVSRPRDPAAEGRAGTLCYMAPEVLREGRVDARSDLYSLGVMLFEWLTGAPPFAGPDAADIINGHLTGEVRWPDRLAADVGHDTITVINLLLEKTPERRPANIEEALARFQEAGLPVDAAAVRQHNLPWHRWTTRRGCPQAPFPVELATAEGKHVRIVFCGDPGSGTAEVLSRWKQELKTHGWSVGEDTHGVCATPPEGRPGSLTIVPLADQAELEPWETAPANGCYVSLRPLAEAEIEQYLRDVLFDPPCVKEALSAAVELSSGLPDALDVILAAWIDSGVIRDQHDSWRVDSPRLRDVKTNAELQRLYGEPLGDLTTSQRRCLEYAAVCGVEVSTEELRRLLELDVVPPGTVDDLFERGILIPWSNPDEPLIDGRFRLAGLAEVWAADLPPQRRRLLHHAIAAALDESRARWGAHVHRRLAHHLWESGQYPSARDAAIKWAELRATAEHAQEAHHYLDLAEAANKWTDTGPEQEHAVARIAYLRGCTFKASGVAEQAQRCFRRVLSLTRRSGDLRLRAETAKSLGDTYKSTRRHEKGERILRIALKNFQQLGDQAEISHTLNNLGNIAWIRGDLDRGLEYYHRALSLQRKLGRTADVASTLSNIGAMYLGKYDFDRAKTYMLESLQLKESLQQRGEAARALNNLGLVSLYAGEFDSAVEYLTRAAAINQAEGAADRWLLNQRNLLEVRLSQAEYRRVVEDSAELLRTASALDGHVNRAYVHLYAARAFHELADYRSSKFHLDRVVELLDAVSDPALSTQYHILQAERRLRLGDREGCTRNLVLALAATDKSGDPRDRAEVYLAAAKAEQTAGQMPPEFFAAGAEAHRLFEKTGLAHRVFEVVLATDDPTLAVFLSRFPLPEGLDNPTTLSYSGPPALQGMWLWRLAEKALAEKATMPTIQFFSAVVEWCQEHGTAELKRRALTELGVLYHQIRDWELAACSFTAAVQELEAVASTIDAPAEREAYLSAGDVRRLNQQVAAFSTHFA